MIEASGTAEHLQELIRKHAAGYGLFHILAYNGNKLAILLAPDSVRRMMGIVLGSGLGPLADAVIVEREVSFGDADLPISTVPGHSGKFIFGELEGAPVLLMKGRVHLYEGHAPRAVTAGVRWMAGQGIERLILTNAAGTLNPDFQPGTWMMLSDHLNLTGTSPLEGADFVDLSAAYDSEWRRELRTTAAALGLPLHEGVYAGLRGPQYETPAEIRMLRVMGADVVGMSTVLETIQARSLGLRVAAFSCLTNWAAGISSAPLDHHEVLETGKQSAQAMIGLLKAALKP
jgi:purine-nucleoside phosphorylase